jgi:hypothetical protein
MRPLLFRAQQGKVAPLVWAFRKVVAISVPGLDEAGVFHGREPSCDSMQGDDLPSDLSNWSGRSRYHLTVSMVDARTGYQLCLMPAGRL